MYINNSYLINLVYLSFRHGNSTDCEREEVTAPVYSKHAPNANTEIIPWLLNSTIVVFF